MRLSSAWIVLAVLVGVAVVLAGCPKKPAPEGVGEGMPPQSLAEEPAETSGAQAEPGEETDEQKRARGEQVMAEYEDAAEPPVNWSWEKEQSVDASTIPDEPAAGVVVGKVFTVKHAILQEDKDEETGKSTWDLRFLDVEPTQGEEHSFYGHDTERHIELTIPKAAKGVKVEAPWSSDKWDINSLWFWYQTPTVESPDGVSMNPNNNVSLYLEFTDWDETPDPANEQIIGHATGRIGVGSWMHGDAICWLAGTFEAVIAAP